ncbi:mediator of DNA damage checkpoint protein 1-like [Pollicipes pollicipes]|uniref:mediator of DNA damage checkpoint protein 1-like n=1 Tax=Pollicipes pollicipes TaxID=41117 RepID=UPI001884DF97|nr:mediator of DNA damage checkpoint protein 1-like [Pollicipes pollicipes]
MVATQRMASPPAATGVHNTSGSELFLSPSRHASRESETQETRLLPPNSRDVLQVLRMTASPRPSPLSERPESELDSKKATRATRATRAKDPRQDGAPVAPATPAEAGAGSRTTRSRGGGAAQRRAVVKAERVPAEPSPAHVPRHDRGRGAAPRPPQATEEVEEDAPPSSAATSNRGRGRGAVRRTTRAAEEVVQDAPPSSAATSNHGRGRGAVRRRTQTAEEVEEDAPPSSAATSNRGRDRGAVRRRTRTAEEVEEDAPPSSAATSNRGRGLGAFARTARTSRRRAADDDTESDSRHEDSSVVTVSSQVSLRSVGGSRRGASARGRPRVLFTGFSSPQNERAVTALGGEMVKRPAECTVLVTTEVKRTIKFMACFARGIPIVSPAWLTKSKQAKFFLDPWEFLVRDGPAEKKFGFHLDLNLRKASRSAHPLLRGWSFYVTPHVVPPPDQLREIVECAGGVFLAGPPRSAADRLLVVSCVADTASWTAARRLHLPVVSAELLLSGILQQRVDVDAHRLLA